MSKNVFLLIAFTFSLAVSSAIAQYVKVRSAGNGKLKINSGKTVSIINLRKDLSGCPIVYDGSDPSGRKIDITKFDLIDLVKNRISLRCFTSDNGRKLQYPRRMRGNCGFDFGLTET